MGFLMLLRYAVLGFGISENLVTCLNAFSAWVPDTRITATPHLPCPIKPVRKKTKRKNGYYNSKPDERA